MDNSASPETSSHDKSTSIEAEGFRLAAPRPHIAGRKWAKAPFDPPDLWSIHEGEVQTVLDFGAFVRLESYPSRDGLVHVSQMKFATVRRSFPDIILDLVTWLASAFRMADLHPSHGLSCGLLSFRKWLVACLMVPMTWLLTLLEYTGSFSQKKTAPLTSYALCVQEGDLVQVSDCVAQGDIVKCKVIDVAWRKEKFFLSMKYVDQTDGKDLDEGQVCEHARVDHEDACMEKFCFCA